MIRKRTALVCLFCVAFSAIMFLCFLGYPLLTRAASISGICSNPESWVETRVRVQGVLKGPFLFIPEEVPPYYYMLEEPQTGKHIGITWKDANLHPWELENQNVTVIGIVKKGFTIPLIARTVYYIEAEETRTNTNCTLCKP